mmetsp:Transcript_18258/g.37241  ORF Transcript_18258/g.37241 Transcript_18258/m.37241 type:complete len:224 (-) Transcript_18258:1073-1744(-)
MLVCFCLIFLLRCSCTASIPTSGAPQLCSSSLSTSLSLSSSSAVSSSKLEAAPSPLSLSLFVELAELSLPSPSSSASLSKPPIFLLDRGRAAPLRSPETPPPTSDAEAPASCIFFVRLFTLSCLRVMQLVRPLTTSFWPATSNGELHSLSKTLVHKWKLIPKVEGGENMMASPQSMYRGSFTFVFVLLCRSSCCQATCSSILWHSLSSYRSRAPSCIFMGRGE